MLAHHFFVRNGFMPKGSFNRLVIVFLALALSIFKMLPDTEVLLPTPTDDFSSSIQVANKPFLWSGSTYTLQAVGSGNVGETEGLAIRVLDEQEKELSSISVGPGYNNRPVNLPGGLVISFNAGSLKDGATLKLQTEARYMSLGLDLVGGSELEYSIRPTKKTLTSAPKIDPKTGKAVPEEESEESSNNIEDALDIFRKKLDGSGLKEIFVQGIDNDKVLVQLPGLNKEEVDAIKKLLQTQGKLEFLLAVADPDSPAFGHLTIADPDRNRELLRRAKSYKDQGVELPVAGKFEYRFVGKKIKNPQTGAYELIPGTEQLMEAHAWITGKDLESTRVISDPETGMPAIEFNIKASREHVMRSVTERNMGRQLAIVLDDSLQTAPRINGIIGARGQITGDYTLAEARSVVAVLRAGSMNVKPELITENTVGPTLGHDSIDSGFRACVLGAVFVLGLMFIYYRGLGIIANFALVMNVTVLLGLLHWLGATLTLPGIAGIALTIGMAVDATVLIYERLREECARKQHFKAAIENSYNKAFVTIFDSNFTTVITGAILISVVDSGPVKGFCTTLITGLVINLFTSVFVTQTIMALAVNKGWLKTIKLLPFESELRYDFIKLSKSLRYLSIAIILVGMFFMFKRGENNLDVDFMGGNMVQIQLLQEVSTDQVRQVLNDGGFINPTVQSFGDEQGMAYTIRLGELDDAGKIKLFKTLHEKLPLPKSDSDAFPRFTEVGSVAATKMLSMSGLALVLSMLAILFYILLRFSEFKYGLAACLALAHDVAITLGMLAIMGVPINLTVFAAILTIVGYSLNDTIVIFDRIRENIGKQKHYDFYPLATRSLNQTLSRTLRTSLTTIAVVLSLLILGGGVINSFALTMFIGIITGTYSSLFIAVPFVNFLMNREKAIPVKATR